VPNRHSSVAGKVAYNIFMSAHVRFAAVWLLAACVLAWAGPVGSEKFAGTWEAKAKGTTFLVLRISAGEKISGTMKAGAVHMDDNGELLDVGPAEESENPIFFAQVEGDTLTFNFQDTDDEVMSFELKLTGENAGELRILDKDHPALKAFPVKRANG
jgi:hypothetical protein